jgi:hypothetical protein
MTRQNAVTFFARQARQAAVRLPRPGRPRDSGAAARGATPPRTRTDTAGRALQSRRELT